MVDRTPSHHADVDRDQFNSKILCIRDLLYFGDLLHVLSTTMKSKSFQAFYL